MTSPDERADGSARNAATKQVEDALRSGRIVQADHDMRVSQLQGAQTMQEIDLLVRDLRPAPGAPGQPGTQPTAATPMVSAGEQPWRLVNYGPASSGGAELAQAVGKGGKGGKAVGGVVAFLVLAAVIVPIAAAAIAFFAARDSFPDFDDIGPTDDTTYLPGQGPGEDGVNVLTVDGFTALVDAVREEKGDTFTHTTVIYPRYAVVQVPTGKNERYESYYWDGRTLEKNTSRGSTTDDQIDLALVDPRQIIRMLETVRGQVEDPDQWYVIIHDPEATETQISAHASNEFSETATLVETLGGTVLYESQSAPNRS